MVSSNHQCTSSFLSYETSICESSDVIRIHITCLCSVSLQSDIATYWPGVHNNALLVVLQICVNKVILRESSNMQINTKEPKHVFSQILVKENKACFDATKIEHQHFLHHSPSKILNL